MNRPSLVPRLTALLLVAGCAGSPDDSGPATDPGTQAGTLGVALAIGDYDGPGGAKAMHTVDFVDVLHTVHSISASTGIARAGTDDLEWVPVLEGGTEQLDSALVIEGTLPAGEYRSIRIEQSNALTWMCTDGTDTHAFPMVQAGGDPEAHLIQVFTVAANFTDDGSGTLADGMPGESMGTSFEIGDGTDTRLTIRTNLDTVDWNDADADGAWSDGDALENWTTIPGTETMVDFIVE